MPSFPSIRIEGGLLGPDLLDQLVAGDLPGQKATDFGLEARRNLTDEIAAVFADARALWGVFQNRLGRTDPQDPGTTVTREWVISLMGLLGYEVVFNQRAYELDGMTFAVSHRAGEMEDAPAVHIVGARQELGRLAPSGRPRLAPHSLVQEYLNRTDQVWGLVTNGTTLRVLRDSTLIRRQAYVEFDLAGILAEQRFLDFAAFYRLLHRTRLPKGPTDSAECLLEKYYAHSVEQGGRVRDHLRDGVEECIERLANGFLTHRENDELRRQLSDGQMKPEDLYRELLRLIYRLLFLLVSEDRGLLSPSPIYREYYGVARLRRMLDRRSAATEHNDLWHGLRLLWQVFGKEEWAAMLELAPLNGELFSPQTLDACSISNRDLLGAFWYLAFYQESASATARRVNYAALDVEELGSVYESLLEFHPTVDRNADGRPVFRLISGSERKTTGSYYTPRELVAELVESALVPVMRQRLDEAAKADKREGGTKHQQSALLSLRILDPACGSGHMLLAAARRIGKELARLRSGEEEPAPERVRETIRDVISHCIYGVDKNLLSVDLCRVALWLESHLSGKPLSFLDHRIRPGDSLVGVFDLTTLTSPIPDAAFRPLAGDDKAVARQLAERNRTESLGESQAQLPISPDQALAHATKKSQSVDAIPDGATADIQRKKKAYEATRHDPTWVREWAAANLWTNAFFARLNEAAVESRTVPTTGAIRAMLAGGVVDARTVAAAETAALGNRFFHWPLEFPEVFAGGGFDVILTNPPWERVKLQEQEFFASRDAEIALAPTKAARTELIGRLRENNPDLHDKFTDAVHASEAASLFLRESGRYPLSGRGDINTYAVFTELVGKVLAPKGRAGIIVPVGIATDDTTKHLFGDLVKQNRLVALTGYENEEKIFPAVNNMFRFCSLVIGGAAAASREARLAFFIRRYDQLRDEHRYFSLSASDFTLLSPNTGSCPTFRSSSDAELTKAIYRRVPVLLREGKADGNPWDIRFSRMFDMANDSHHFRTADQLETEGYRLKGNVFWGSHDRYLPLYEAKMLHQFDHRFSTYEGAAQGDINSGRLPQTTAAQKASPDFCVQPRYWVRDEVVDSALPHYPEPLYAAIRTHNEDSVRSVLLFWLAGYHLANGNDVSAHEVLFQRDRYDVAREVSRALAEYPGEAGARRMQRLFPLTQADVATLSDPTTPPMDAATALVARFSPKWLAGWRDITNAANERTTIVSAAPPTAFGHTFPLLFSRGVPANLRLALVAALNSYVADYCARQKVGGTHVTYGLLNQFAIPSPQNMAAMFLGAPFCDFIITRALELVYTSTDMSPLAQDCGYRGAPYRWDDERRDQIRAEIDAAFMYAYLGPSNVWESASSETKEDLARLQSAFSTPKDAATHILDSFWLTREKDEKAHGDYRTRETILSLYDAFTDAQKRGSIWTSPLCPSPGMPTG